MLLRNVSSASNRGSFLERRLGIVTTGRSTSESADQIRGSFGLNLLHEPPEPIVDFIFVCNGLFFLYVAYQSDCRFMDYVAGLAEPGVTPRTLHFSGQSNGFPWNLGLDKCASIPMATTPTGAKGKAVYSISMILAALYLGRCTLRLIYRIVPMSVTVPG